MERPPKSYSVEEVLNLETKRHINSELFFLHEHDPQRKAEIKEIRYKIEKEELNYVCAYCKTPVWISGSKNGNHHFKHKVGSTSSCPYRSDSELTEKEINRIRYLHKRESQEHIRLKQQLKSGLEETPYVENVKEEETHFNESLVNTHHWKRPDIQFDYGDLKVVFEAQVSQLFLSVIVERNDYYRDNKMYILWVFDNFDYEDIHKPFYQDDIFESQNKNVFVFDYEAEILTNEKNELHLKCFYRVPEINFDRLHDIEYNEFYNYPFIEDKWESKYISIKDLSFNDDYTVYYHNYNNKRKQIVDHELQKEATRIFNTGKDNNEIAFINGAMGFEFNISSITERLRNGITEIQEYERGDEFKELARPLRKRREGVDKRREAIEERRRIFETKRATSEEQQQIFDNKNKEFQANDTEFRRVRILSEQISKLDERIEREEGEYKYRFIQGRGEIIERIRKREENIEKEVRADLQRELDRLRREIDEDIRFEKREIVSVERDIKKKLTKGRHISRTLIQECKNGKRIEQVVRKRTRTEISEKYRIIRSEHRKTLSKFFRGEITIAGTKKLFDPELQGWRFLINFERSTRSLQRFKIANEKSRTNKARK